ncbi:MAG: SufD family Fe-S cluster assembly protein [Tissierellia bacterium]|nr:SufD family Fe-S cluster assembly protein [Tissierellia bacterium]
MDSNTKKIADEIIKTVSDLDGLPKGAFNIRVNGGCAAKHSTDTVRIEPKTDKSGIDIYIKENTKDEVVYIPACITKSNVDDLVYNDFHIGKNAKVRIVAGCGVHVDGDEKSKHAGVHRFFVGEGAHVTYLERHIGIGNGKGEAIIDPKTYCEIEKNGYLEMITSQIGGVDHSVRDTDGKLYEGATLIIKENLMTEGDQYTETNFNMDVEGKDAGITLISRSVAKDNSYQKYKSTINGNNKCTGHSACDAIIVGNAKVDATPELIANHPDAMLIHEAAIGKIAGEQIIKLQTLGLTEEEAEQRIINGFLKV